MASPSSVLPAPSQWRGCGALGRCRSQGCPVLASHSGEGLGPGPWLLHLHYGESVLGEARNAPGVLGLGVPTRRAVGLRV